MGFRDNEYRTCAFCKETEPRYNFEREETVLFKYSTRRYAHASCGVKRIGEVEFRKKLPEVDRRAFDDRMLMILRPGRGK